MNTTFKSQEDFIMKQKSRLKKPLAVMLSLMLIISAFTALPVTASAATAESAAGAKSGKTGDCTWSLDDNGTLTISGNGAMKDYYSTESLPWGNTIEKVIIKNGVTAIGNYTFDGCYKLTSVSIPDSVKSIGDYVFCGCGKLTSVNIPNSVTSIGGDAFSGTSWYFNQPDGLVYAGKVAYKYKGDMPDGTSVTIKDGTKGISDGALSYYEEMTSITIPDSVTWIGEQACGFLFASYVVEGFTEYANNNPTAKKYANDNGFKFVGPDVKLGDVNGDGVVNGSDAGILARYVSGWKQYDKYFNK